MNFRTAVLVIICCIINLGVSASAQELVLQPVGNDFKVRARLPEHLALLKALEARASASRERFEEPAVYEERIRKARVELNAECSLVSRIESWDASIQIDFENSIISVSIELPITVDLPWFPSPTSTIRAQFPVARNRLREFDKFRDGFHVVVNGKFISSRALAGQTLIVFYNTELLYERP